jgi:hypothetical protein
MEIGLEGRKEGRMRMMESGSEKGGESSGWWSFAGCVRFRIRTIDCVVDCSVHDNLTAGRFSGLPSR